MKKTTIALALAVAVAQIGAASAALQITSPAVTIAALEAKKACALAAQTAAMVQVDQTTLANLERLKALCDAAANKPVPSREWPEEIKPEGRAVIDTMNVSEGLKALFECRQLAEQRALAGKASLTSSQIKEIAQLTKPPGGMAVFDPEATVAFVEIRNMCAQAHGHQN